MKKTNQFLVLVLVVAFGAVPPVLAKKKRAARGPSSVVSTKQSGDYVIEKRSDGTTVKYKKKTTYDFEGVGIEGIHNKPSGALVSNIKDVKGKSIIRIRQNFDSEVIDSVRQMR